VPLLNLFNRVKCPDYTNDIHIPLITADFTRLYTNIDLTDLKSRTLCVVEEFFQHHAPAGKYIKLPLKKHHGEPRWLKKLPTVHDADSIILTKDSFAELFVYLIDNSYFQFAGQAFKQTKGIVMGSNMAVYLANLYLFTYEFDFIQQDVFRKPAVLADCAVSKHNHSVWVHARDIIQGFMFTGRYIDDLINIGSRKFCEPALLNINHPHKYNITIGNKPPVYINGIYPCATDNHDGFTIEIQHACHEGTMYNWFMDLAIYRYVQHDTPCSQYFKTGIYNKRSFALHMLPAPTYTHVHSHCSHWCHIWRRRCRSVL
jgi:hypothetical protein